MYESYDMNTLELNTTTEELELLAKDLENDVIDHETAYKHIVEDLNTLKEEYIELMGDMVALKQKLHDRECELKLSEEFNIDISELINGINAKFNYITCNPVVYIVEDTPLSDILWLMLLDAIFTFLLLIVVRLAMIVSYDLFKSKMRERMNIKRILVYGTHEKSIAVITRLLDSSHYDIVGFISPSSSDKRIRISNFKVYHASTEEELNNLATDLGLSGILFTTEQDAQTEQDRLIQMATSLNIKILVVPSINEVEGNNLLHYRVREIKIEDLLGRPEIEISIDEIRKRFSDNVILVTGAAGFVGSNLCEAIL